MRTVILGLRRGLGFLAVTLVVALLQAQAALAQRAGDWVELGRQPVGIGLDKDVIQLDRADGRFDGLKLRVENGNVLLLGINVVFGNGDRQDIPVTGLMRSGQETTTLDLDGGRRFIDRIELQYGTLGLGGRRPVVIVMGRVGARPARPADVATVEPGWQDGGSEALNRRGGVVTFQVGRRAGWLEAIALTAQGVDIPIEQVEVVYANDDRERLRAPRTIQRRQSTGPLELRDGNGGRVDSVRVTYGRFQPGNRDVALQLSLLPGEQPAPERFTDLGDEWVSLGRQRVEQRGDSDVITVGPREGRFDALVLRVRRSPIRLRSVTVVYGNGEREEVSTPVRIDAGADSEIFELADYSGRGRVISEIRLSYGTRDGNRPAIVEVFAHKAPEERFADLGDEWQSLGRERVEQRGDSAVISVGRGEGRFDALVLRVRRSPIRLRSVTVVYGNGEREEVSTPVRIDAGADSEIFELADTDGRGRVIREIRLSYGTRDGNRPAIVEVFGHKAPEERFTDLGNEWQSLGRQRVDQRGDADVISVGRGEGRFDALVLRVRRSPIRLRSVTVVYGNGEREEVSTPVRIDAGADSEIFELADTDGRGRVIREIRLSYGTRDGNRPAIVEVFAHKAPEERFTDLGNDWVSLGRQRVDQRGDADVISVGRQEGRFDELVLRVRRSPIRLRSVTVVYGNGQQEVLDTPMRIDAGTDSEVLELADVNDRGRFIREIRLSYGTRDANRPAIVEVFGHKAREERFADLGAGWAGIGKAQLTDRRGRIALDLTGYDKRLDSFILRMRRGSLTHNEVVVVFEDGQRQVFDRNGRIDSGDQSAPFELDRRGRGRFIDRIEIAYRVDPDGRRTPEIELWGEEARARRVDFEPLGRDWEQLGSAEVDGGRDRDVLRVGRREGAFSDVLLRIKGAPLRIARATVTYGNGDKDDLPARGFYGPGDQTEILPLTTGRAGGRFIASIELVYEQARRRGGRGEVEIWARAARQQPTQPPRVDTLPELGPAYTALSTVVVSGGRSDRTITLGRGMGTFHGLVLQITKAPVEIERITVVYGNGRNKSFGFRGTIDAPNQTDLIDVDPRIHIERIVLRMSPARRGGDAPNVRVWGLRAPPTTANKPRLPQGFGPLGGVIMVNPDTGQAVIGIPDQRQRQQRENTQ